MPYIGEEAHKRYRTKLWEDALAAYGAHCHCPGCPENREGTDVRFLTIEHIQGMDESSLTPHQRVGAAGRRRKARWQMLANLRRRGWPEGYTILCFNCNCGQNANNGVCPHMDGTR